MADIELICTNCGREMTVSEYVDFSELACKGCGSPMKTPDEPEDVAQKRPTIQTRTYTPSIHEPDPDSDEEADGDEIEHSDLQSTMITARENMRSRSKKGMPSGKKHIMATGATFLAIGLIFGSLRWVIADQLDSDLAFTIKTGVLYALGALHVATVILSFKEDVFQGMLCSVVPLYSVYYLFMVQDNFWIRSIAGGMLVGYGYDAAIAMYVIGGGMFDTIDSFISTGGGD